jgi:iron complex outermembrane receptor protein
MRANIGNYIYDNVSSNFGVERSILSPSGILLNSTRDIYNSGFYNNYYQSDYYVKNASFLKVDNISLGYNAGTLLGSKSNLRVTAACQNPVIISKYKGIDPESTSGIDYNLYPRPVSFIIGLNIDF